MIFTRKSRISGSVTTMDLPISDAQWARFMDGVPLRAAAPQLNPTQLGFFFGGLSPQECVGLTLDEIMTWSRGK